MQEVQTKKPGGSLRAKIVMKRIALGLTYLILILPLVVGCARAPAVPEARLGEEFLLAIGQEVHIAGEDLQISFEDVTEDSRCPLNVTCIWEGRATNQVRITYAGMAYGIELTEPGLTDHATEAFRDYRMTYHLKPYPGEMENISKAYYRLQMTVSKGG